MPDSFENFWLFIYPCGIQNVKVKDFLKFEEIKTLSKPSPKSNLWINLPTYKSVIFRNIINVRDIAKGREIIKV